MDISWLRAMVGISWLGKCCLRHIWLNAVRKRFHINEPEYGFATGKLSGIGLIKTVLIITDPGSFD
jgi:hypothetical protein